MTEYKDFKIGNAVKHKFRERKYQKGVIISIDEHRLPLIKILFEDGFYKSNEESEIPYMDIVKLK